MRKFDDLIIKRLSLVTLTTVVLWSCGDSKKETVKQPEKAVIQAPAFNADSAYSFVQKQVDFGPRVPNTAAHGFTGDYLIAKLESLGAVVKVQAFEETTHDGESLSLRNIMGQFNPDANKRILLGAHWDTRPYTDKDTDNPVGIADGANDGASGIGVLLEIARQISIKQPSAGVDILFFDGEDWGEKEKGGSLMPPSHLQSWWALGSQYWSKNKGGYSAYYGILLDMVGAKGAQFYIEGYSDHYAPKITKKVWNTASQSGYGTYFVHQLQGGIMDDHYFVNEVAKIPMIDIIQYDPTTGSFGDYHHTMKDNMYIIDKRTLKAVGQTVMQVIYNE